MSDSPVSVSRSSEFDKTMWKWPKQAYQSADNKHPTFLMDMLAFGNDVELLFLESGVCAIQDTCLRLNGDQILSKVAAARRDSKTIPVRSLDRDGGESTGCGSIALMSLRCCFSIEFTAAGNVRTIAAFVCFVPTGEEAGVAWVGGECGGDGEDGEEGEGSGEVHVTLGKDVAS